MRISDHPKLPEKIELKYIYDNGFGPMVYRCVSCGSHELIQKPVYTFSPPDYDCDNCGKTCGAPLNEKLKK